MTRVLRRSFSSRSSLFVIRRAVGDANVDPAKVGARVPTTIWGSKSGKESTVRGMCASVYPRGVIVVRCMVIGRLAASILTTREPQITLKLKLPPYTTLYNVGFRDPYPPTP